MQNRPNGQGNTGRGEDPGTWKPSWLPFALTPNTTVLLVGGLLTFAVLAYVVPANIYWWLTETTTEDVENRIARELLTDAGTEEILSFCDRNGWENEGPILFEDSSLVFTGLYPSGTTIIHCTVEGASHVAFQNQNIELYFRLGPDGTLADHILQPHVTTALP